MEPMGTHGTRRVAATAGVEIAVHHLGGDGSPVILAHATGFHGRAWGPLASALVPHHTVWALDQRGHGDSARSPDGRYSFEIFASDLMAVIDAIGGEGWRAVGHSLGGGVVLLAEGMRPGTFASICCYEPVVMPPPQRSAASSDPSPAPLVEAARKRRASFSSREEALENYRSKAPFDSFDPTALEAYVCHAFVDEPDGSVSLACRPEDEAAVFSSALASPGWGLLGAVECPVAILAGAARADPLSTLAIEIARRLPAGRIGRFEHLDHFGPFVAPIEVGDVMAACLGDPTAESTIAVTCPR